MKPIKYHGQILDTNILVRALIDKNEELAKSLEGSSPVHIPLPIIFETIFVLEKVYKLNRNVIADYISTVLSYENVESENVIAGQIIDLYLKKKRLSVIDCYLLVYSKMYGLKLNSFDRTLIGVRK